MCSFILRQKNYLTCIDLNEFGAIYIHLAFRTDYFLTVYSYKSCDEIANCQQFALKYWFLIAKKINSLKCAI